MINRLEVITLSISLCAHIAVLGSAAVIMQDRELPQTLENYPVQIDRHKPALLPQVRLIGDIKQFTNSQPQSSAQAKEEDQQAIQQDRLVHSEAETVDMQTDDAAKRAMLRYQDIVKQEIEANRYYPMRAQRMRLEGVVDIAFVINPDGSSRNVRILQSSGLKFLDKQALDTIYKASPFRPLPRDIGRGSVEMRVAIVFSLK